RPHHVRRPGVGQSGGKHSPTAFGHLQLPCILSGAHVIALERGRPLAKLAHAFLRPFGVDDAQPLSAPKADHGAPRFSNRGLTWSYRHRASLPPYILSISDEGCKRSLLRAGQREKV